ncbi:IS1182 family transposase [Lichenicoccus roseus]|uniref:IS1182 family transposase n=1 Tax=Lichenicoccus roseus TaxID=2683649 RepID=A0A5R9J4W1_9PROT|nr:IS1182 family transposase [Lichenicoccus roseus]TLU70651.1 IS1182 family transposase [Lichenicoccus roseus]
MSRFIEGLDRRQTVLLPSSLNDYVGEDNQVRVVEVFIDSLDLAELGFAGMVPEATGGPAYHPSTLLRIYLYGYLNRIPSSRRLEREAQRNLELIWLTGRLAPDHKTIADFRRNNGPAIQAVCRQFVLLCRRIGLFADTGVAIDGSKFKAVNSRDRNLTPYKLERRMQQVDESIRRYLEAMETADRYNDAGSRAKSVRLAGRIAELREQMRRFRDMEQAVLAAPDQQISLTDPDARSMATSGKGSGIVGYNVQAAVDTEHHLIVAHTVINAGHDRTQLAPMTELAQEATGRQELTVLADRGYFSGRQVLACVEAGAIPYVPKPLTSGSKADNRFGKQDFVYLPKQDAYRCPAGALLTSRYETVEKDMTLHCYLTDACMTCSVKAKCTTGKERRIKRWEHEDVLDAMQKRLDQVGQAMRLRRRTVEHPFGTIKAWMGATHFLTRTLGRVSTEMSLQVLAYNMKRVIAIMGTEALMHAMRA